MILVSELMIRQVDRGEKLPTNHRPLPYHVGTSGMKTSRCRPVVAVLHAEGVRLYSPGASTARSNSTSQATHIELRIQASQICRLGRWTLSPLKLESHPN